MTSKLCKNYPNVMQNAELARVPKSRVFRGIARVPGGINFWARARRRANVYESSWKIKLSRDPRTALGRLDWGSVMDGLQGKKGSQRDRASQPNAQRLTAAVSNLLHSPIMVATVPLASIGRAKFSCNYENERYPCQGGCSAAITGRLL